MLTALRCAHRAALLKAFAAEHGPTLSRAKRHRRIFTTLRASGFRFGTHRRTAAAVCAAAHTFGTLGFARLASLGLVLEALIGEKHLLAGSEYELRIAFRALQYLVVEFHEPLPLARAEREGMSEPCTVGPGREELLPPGGKQTGCRISLGLRYLATTQRKQLLDRVYITEARRPEECEEGSGGPH